MFVRHSDGYIFPKENSEDNNLKVFRLKMLQNKKEDGGFEFIVRFCRDVFLEALLFGDRRRLTKLERAGRRFLLIIENFFKERPFLRLGLGINAYLFI